MKWIATLVLCLTFLGCSLPKIKSSGRQFHFERAWARKTTQIDPLAYAKINQMAPLFFGELVIQGNSVDGLTAYEKSSGHVRWRKDIKGGVEGGAAIGKDTIFFGANDGFFYAVDAYTGRNRWTFPIRAEGLGRPLFVDGVVYFLAGNNMFYALSAGSGEQVWTYSRQDGANLTVRGASEPSASGDRILVGFSDGYLVALNKGTGGVVWERRLGTNPKFKDVDSKPLVRGDRIYVASYDGLFYALALKDGSIRWAGEEGGFQTAHLHEDKLFLGTSDGRVVSLDARSGKKVWELKLKSSVASSPVYYRGLVLFGEWSGDLVAVDALSGQVVDRYSTGRGVISPVSVDFDAARAYVLGRDADLYAFRLSWQLPSVRWEWEKRW